jgi:hypothetical protein
LVKEPNTMTNATVAEIEEVSYKQGEGEQKAQGSQTIYVPHDLPVVQMEKASDRSVLQPGKRAFLVVRDDADSSRTVLAVVVGEGGATPQCEVLASTPGGSTLRGGTVTCRPAGISARTRVQHQLLEGQRAERAFGQ